ncbi:hypothetical protein CS022_10150 [Veronia nyctiphanis]|uniref:Translocation and assembly module subunit TamA n=2 Tax=Veronia nyctiphanis TaxID=1278244 RepID=A0A4Q0YRS3_9GAMM|nr:hypothetical protein CS022_10150 [Veronia nyctiphanis]
MLLCLSLFTFSSQADTSFNIVIDNDELEKNIELYLSAIPEAQRYKSVSFEKRVRGEATKALEALGYYHAKIQVVPETESDTDLIFMVTVEPGEPVILDKVDITVIGDALNDEAFSDVLAEKPKPGQTLNHKVYDDLKSSLKNLALKRGYFDASFPVAKLEISPSRNLAFIRLHFASGARYRFGEIKYSKQQIQIDRVKSIEPFEPGDPYLVTELGKFNQLLADTGWYASVLVEADYKGAHDATVPVDVTLEPNVRNQFETGIGYSTDSGPRIKINWNKPWYNSRGHSLRNDISLSKPRQSLFTAYKVPLTDVTREYFELSSEFVRLQQDDTNSRTVSLKASRHLNFDEDWQMAFSFRWLYEEFKADGEEKVTNLYLPGVEFNRLRSRGGAMPYWGDRQKLEVEFSDKFIQSDINLLRVTGRTAWIRTLADNHRGLARIDGGGLTTDAFDEVPTSLRFYAGGDSSIRGYGYRSISPRKNGELTGGQYFATGSVEYQYRLTGDWWLAVFTDGGDAWNENLDWKKSAGLGIRWGSPVGPVRFDIAHGFDREEGDDDKFRVHFSVGPQL